MQHPPSSCTPTSDARAALAEAQAALVAALGGAAVANGFDAERVQLAGAMLAHKRRRGVAKAWPSTARALGTEFAPAFRAYAATHALQDGPAADGRAFVRTLSGPVPDACIRERLIHDATRGGLVVRAARASRGLAIVVGWRSRVAWARF